MRLGTFGRSPALPTKSAWAVRSAMSQLVVWLLLLTPYCVISDAYVGNVAAVSGPSGTVACAFIAVAKVMMPAWVFVPTRGVRNAVAAPRTADSAWAELIEPDASRTSPMSRPHWAVRSGFAADDGSAAGAALAVPAPTTGRPSTAMAAAVAPASQRGMRRPVIPTNDLSAMVCAPHNRGRSHHWLAATVPPSGDR